MYRGSGLKNKSRGLCPHPCSRYSVRALAVNVICVKLASDAGLRELHDRCPVGLAYVDLVYVPAHWRDAISFCLNTWVKAARYANGVGQRRRRVHAERLVQRKRRVVNAQGAADMSELYGGVHRECHARGTCDRGHRVEVCITFAEERDMKRGQYGRTLCLRRFLSCHRRRVFWCCFGWCLVWCS